MPPLLQGSLNHIERQASDVGLVPLGSAYIIAHPTIAGRYLLGGTGSVAAAFLKASPIASALGRYVLDDSENDRSLYLSPPSTVFV